MSDPNNNTQDSIGIKRTQSRYITLREDIFQILTKDTLSVYLALRYVADYSQECSTVKKNIKFICEQAKVKRSHCFEAFNELETHGLIKRESKPGYQSIYLVAQDLNYFNHHPQEVIHRPVQQVDTPPVHVVDYPVHVVDTITINSFSNKDLNNIPDFEKSGKTKKGNSGKGDYKADERFMRFYNEYPKKEDPRDAWKAFKSIIGDNDELLEQVIEDIKQRKSRHSRWQDKQFIKYPAVYLRKGEYLGEIFNAEENVQEQKIKNDEIAKQRLLKQEEISRKKADQDKFYTLSKQTDARVYRNVVKNIPTEAQINGMKGLKSILGR